MDSWETRSGKKWTDDDFGFEISPITTTLSHSLMMVVTDAIKEHTSIDAYTAAHGGGGTPDISLPGLSKIAKNKNIYKLIIVMILIKCIKLLSIF